MKSIYYIVLCLTINLSILAQVPNYTEKQFAKDDSDELLIKKLPLDNKEQVRFLVQKIEIWDVDDNNTTHVKFGREVKLCFVSQSDSTKNGSVKAYIFLEPEKEAICIWEQTYKNEVIDGRWNFFNIKGTLVMFQTFKEGTLLGLSRTYDIDGKRILHEREIGNNSVIDRDYHQSGSIKQVKPYLNDKLEGEGFQFYEDGTIMEKVNLKNGEFHGLYTYYYPNGKKWVEIEYKNGEPWTAISNYQESGTARDCGSLKNGTGTLIYYLADGSIDEVQHYKNGKRIK